MNIKSFDMHRKLPSDLTESTTSGAIVSILSSIIMIVLLISEFSSYLSVEETSDMYVDIVRGGQKIKVNINIDFPKFPCDILSLDIQDIMGSHSVNVEGDIHKTRISQEGSYFDKIENNNHKFEMQRALEAYKNNEGCNLSGTMLLNKVPGNFHISSHPYASVLKSVYKKANITSIDLSHKINHLSYGDEFDLKQIKRQFSQGLLHPLDGKNKQKPFDISIGVTYQYYINVIPTTYVDAGNKEYHVYQYTYNSNELRLNNMPAVYFRYDLSPVTVEFSQAKSSFLHFLVQICAIIGGVFTVAGVLDSVVHRTVINVQKKAESGKLT